MKWNMKIFRKVLIYGICVRTKRIHKYKHYVPATRLQVSVWFALIIAAVLIWTISSVWIGLIILLTAQLIPFRLKKRSSTA